MVYSRSPNSGARGSRLCVGPERPVTCDEAGTRQRWGGPDRRGQLGVSSSWAQPEGGREVEPKGTTWQMTLVQGNSSKSKNRPKYKTHGRRESKLKPELEPLSYPMISASAHATTGTSFLQFV